MKKHIGILLLLVVTFSLLSCNKIDEIRKNYGTYQELVEKYETALETNRQLEKQLRTTQSDLEQEKQAILRIYQ